ncbi:translation initiation factor IF-2 [Aerococcus urinaeequi]|jgi:translation initiation factor IF-2|uniref:Translation initiation factor IF-2 n=1 Tax=Aerococcus urinaeequi TaxID=51665 RepID=A0A0U4Y0V9_9LACT|nr:translation initiation factor IF-2 [Aerococcus urinaeequi]ALZ87945.1 translation initiation factor IF-2 [Aerococcus urinaeequi]QOQ79868.1 translation initiation factor IF-2 [Aerococcus urinaeequi]
MSKKRVYEVAKEIGISSKELLNAAEKAGFEYSSHMASMTDDEVNKLKSSFANKSAVKEDNNNQPAKAAESQPTKKAENKPAEKGSAKSEPAKANAKQNQHQNKSQNRNNPAKENKNMNNQKNNFKNNSNNKNGGFKGKGKKGKKGRFNNDQNRPQGNPVPPRKNKPLPEKVEYTEGMTVADIAKKIHREPAEIIKKLFLMGIPATQNQALDKDAIELILEEYGVKAEEKVIVDQADFEHYFEEAKNADEEDLETRPAVVTIMGHVDHGKTTLLDYLRNAQVVDGEAGGITQHIGAYQVRENDRLITFLDTPGHAAFTTMRARGADVTDIVILVVAADDGVMPQTVEAINHAKAAGVPIIVAVNKIDKPTANPDRVMQELTEYGLISEEWGGDTIFVNISAKFGQNVSDLLEMILLVSDVEEYKAVPNRLALGSVIEARLDPSKGAIATLLVQEGTLRVGDPIVVGDTHGRVRVMTNDTGRRIKQAGPSTPVEITGLQESPQAGDRFVAFDDEKTARAVGEERASRALQERRQANHAVTLDNLFETLQEGELKSVNVIIKGDVQGSVEALAGSLKKIEVEGVKVNIVHQAVGAINESDITLGQASQALIIGFNVRPTPQAKLQADADEVEVRLYNIIYDAINDVESAMTGMLDPEFVEEVTGTVQVRETYNVSKVGTIVGGYVLDGTIYRNSQVRIIRDSIVIYDGQLGSLRRFKDDVKEVSRGFELGLTIENYNDIKVDDEIEAYRMVEVKKK